MEANRVLWISALPPLAPPGPEVPEAPALWSTHFRGPDCGLEELRRDAYHAVVLAFPIPHWNAAELLENVRRLAPGVPV